MLLQSDQVILLLKGIDCKIKESKNQRIIAAVNGSFEQSIDAYKSISGQLQHMTPDALSQLEYKLVKLNEFANNTQNLTIPNRLAIKKKQHIARQDEFIYYLVHLQRDFRQLWDQTLTMSVITKDPKNKVVDITQKSVLSVSLQVHYWDEEEKVVLIQKDWLLQQIANSSSFIYRLRWAEITKQVPNLDIDPETCLAYISINNIKQEFSIKTIHDDVSYYVDTQDNNTCDIGLIEGMTIQCTPTYQLKILKSVIKQGRIESNMLIPEPIEDINYKFKLQNDQNKIAMAGQYINSDQQFITEYSCNNSMRIGQGLYMPQPDQLQLSAGKKCHFINQTIKTPGFYPSIDYKSALTIQSKDINVGLVINNRIMIRITTYNQFQDDSHQFAI